MYAYVTLHACRSDNRLQVQFREIEIEMFSSFLWREGGGDINDDRHALECCYYILQLLRIWVALAVVVVVAVAYAHYATSCSEVLS